MNKQVKYFSLLVSAGVIAVSCNSSSDSDHNTSAMGNDTSAATATNPPVNTGTNIDTTAAAKMKNDTSMMKSTTGTAKGKKGKVMIMSPEKSTAAMQADKEGYYSNVEVWPSYPGGQKALEDFFANNIEYPQQATDNGTEGVVNVTFLVDEKGKLTSPKVISKKVGDGVEEEALRVVNKMPTWTPGKIKGNNVKTRYTLPVRFQLTD